MSLLIKPMQMQMQLGAMEEQAGVHQTGLLLSLICPCCHGCKAIAWGEEGKGWVTNRCVAVVNRSLSMYHTLSILYCHLLFISHNPLPIPLPLLSPLRLFLSLSLLTHPLSLSLSFSLSNSCSPSPLFLSIAPSISPSLPYLYPPIPPTPPCLPPSPGSPLVLKADNLIGSVHIISSHYRPSLSTTWLGAHRQVEVGVECFLNQAMLVSIGVGVCVCLSVFV